MGREPAQRLRSVNTMETIGLCLFGYGNVGQAFARLIGRKAALLKKEHAVEMKIVAIATGHHGRAIEPAGMDTEKATSLVRSGANISELSAVDAPVGNSAFLKASGASVFLENTPLNYETGLPAIAHIRAALELGMHVVTANKGAVVFSHRQLKELARNHERAFLFESAVMDGAPIFSLFRDALPAVELTGFFGILNSCTNFILGLLEQGYSFDQAITEGRRIGVTETDPSADIDGWDAAIKVAALSTVLLDIPLTPRQVQRQGIRSLSPDKVKDALSQGKRWKLVCRVQRKGRRVFASVGPELVDPASPLYAVTGTSSFVQFETDTLPGLGILESNPGPETTAYGLLSDLLHAIK
jgi:homoserine dehydrogenase